MNNLRRSAWFDIRLLLLALAVAFAPAAQADEGPAGFLELEIEPPRLIMGRTVGDHLFWIEGFMAGRYAGGPRVAVIIPDDVRGLENKSFRRPAGQPITVRTYLDALLKEAGVASHAWEIGQRDVRFVRLNARSHRVSPNAKRSMIRLGKYSTEGLQEILAGRNLSFSAYFEVSLFPEGDFIIAKGTAEDLAKFARFMGVEP